MNEQTNAMRTGFVGAGRMAQALAQGMAGIDWISAICFVDPSEQAAAKFREKCPRAVQYNTAGELASKADIILLAVKPQVMPQVLEGLSEFIEQHHLIVSVAAGIALTDYRAALKTNCIVRVMPNTPCLIGEGMSAMCDAGVSAEQREQVVKILEAVGSVAIVEEAQMDAVTGLSGSGPAYVFSFIESLAAGGIDQGLTPELAHQLATQTVLGAARLVIETGDTPRQLREQVTSPGGTTLAGLAALDETGFDSAVRAAVAAATGRSRELA